MDLMVMEKHDGYGEFPVFKKGAAVCNFCACDEYPHWYSCVIDKYETFVPETHVADGFLIRDYDPTELIIEKGETVTLIDIVFEWVYVIDKYEQTGWLPASKIVSI